MSSQSIPVHLLKAEGRLLSSRRRATCGVWRVGQSVSVPHDPPQCMQHLQCHYLAPHTGRGHECRALAALATCRAPAGPGVARLRLARDARRASHCIANTRISGQMACAKRGVFRGWRAARGVDGAWPMSGPDGAQSALGRRGRVTLMGFDGVVSRFSDGF